jgi:superfamily II DNA or RNA helicase
MGITHLKIAAGPHCQNSKKTRGATVTLRPYQSKAVDAALEWMRKSVDPFCIEAATGAGKPFKFWGLN